MFSSPNPLEAYTCSEYTCYYFSEYTCYYLSARWVIVVRCLQNTWHGPHRLSDFGIKNSQIIVRMVSSSSTVLNILFSIFALTFFCLSKNLKSVPWTHLFFITSGKLLFPRHIWNSKWKSNDDCTTNRFIYDGNLERYVNYFHIVFCKTNISHQKSSLFIFIEKLITGFPSYALMLESGKLISFSMVWVIFWVLAHVIVSWIVNSSLGKSECGFSCSVTLFLYFTRKFCSLSIVCFIKNLQLLVCSSKGAISVSVTSLWLFFLIMSSLLLQLHMHLGWISATSWISAISSLKSLKISLSLSLSLSLSPSLSLSLFLSLSLSFSLSLVTVFHYCIYFYLHTFGLTSWLFCKVNHLVYFDVLP